jgi:molybdenum cofactor biosynthesis protein B
LSEVIERHKAHAPKCLGIAIVTASTSRYNEKVSGAIPYDISGDKIEELMKTAGHRIEERLLLPDDSELIRSHITRMLASQSIDVIIITGGTGLSPRDVTIESIRDLIEKEMPGFGELFRKLSYESIGSSAMLTRALAGVARRKAIFCLPGSPQAVEIAVTRLIMPEIQHIIGVARE